MKNVSETHPTFSIKYGWDSERGKVKMKYMKGF